jgi:hypothetical protein
VDDSNAEDQETGESTEVTGPSVNDGNAEDEETEEAADPSADDGNAEDKENMRERSENISSEKSQTSSTCTELEDGSAEVQSARKPRRGEPYFFPAPISMLLIQFLKELVPCTVQVRPDQR